MNKTDIDWADTLWKPIPCSDGYYASKDGKILSTKRKIPIIMQHIESDDGHEYIWAFDNGAKKKMWVHRAVLSAWTGSDEKNLECRHLDDDPHNNHLANLAWGTRLQNVADKRVNGGIPTGERSGTHKLTEKQVVEIRSLYGTKSTRELGKMFGVSHTCIRRAAKGIKWSCVKEGLL